MKANTDLNSMISHNTIAYRPQTGISRNKQEPVQAVLLMKGLQYKKNDPFKTISAEDHYSSVSKISYCNQGDPKKIKATLDEDRRLDLRRSHFKVGKESE